MEPYLKGVSLDTLCKTGNQSNHQPSQEEVEEEKPNFNRIKSSDIDKENKNPNLNSILPIHDQEPRGHGRKRRKRSICLTSPRFSLPTSSAKFS